MFRFLSDFVLAYHKSPVALPQPPNSNPTKKEHQTESKIFIRSF